MTDEPPKEPHAATPGWVKVFAVIGVLVVLLFVILLATGGHGPSRHGGGSATAVDHAP